MNDLIIQQLLDQAQQYKNEENWICSYEDYFVMKYHSQYTVQVPKHKEEKE